MADDGKKGKQLTSEPWGLAPSLLPVAIVAQHGPYFSQVVRGASVMSSVAGGVLSPVLNLGQLALGETLNHQELQNGAKAGLKGNAYGAVIGAVVAGVSCAIVDAGLTTTGVGAVSWANMPACIAAGASMGSAFGGFAGQLIYTLEPEVIVPSVSNAQQPSSLGGAKK